MTFLGNDEELVRIAAGFDDAKSSVLKFGRNQSMSTGVREEIWDGTGVYPYPATADITHIKAVASGDEGLNIEIQGLDINYALVVQTKALDGADSSTLVALDTPLLRVFRKDIDDSTNAVNNIQCLNAAGSVVYSQISTPFNQTLMALYTVPAGVTAYLTRYYCQINKKTNAAIEVEVYVRPFGKVFQLKHNGVIASGGDAHWDFNYLPTSPPLKIEEKSDIKITGLASAAGVDCSAGFDLILIDN